MSGDKLLSISTAMELTHIHRNVGCSVVPYLTQIPVHVPHLNFKSLVLRLSNSVVSTSIFFPSAFSEIFDPLQCHKEFKRNLWQTLS